MNEHVHEGYWGLPSQRVKVTEVAEVTKVAEGVVAAHKVWKRRIMRTNRGRAA